MKLEAGLTRDAHFKDVGHDQRLFLFLQGQDKSGSGLQHMTARG